MSVRVRARARVRVRVRVSLTLTLPLTRRPSRSALSRLWRRRRGCTCSMARCSRVSCVPKMGRCWGGALSLGAEREGETFAWRAWRFQGDFGALEASGLVAESRAPSGALHGGMEPWLGLRLGPRPAAAMRSHSTCVVIATRDMFLAHALTLII